MKHTTSGDAVRKAQWMADFEDLVKQSNPAHYIRIEWNDAMHLHYSNYTPAEAAERYLAARQTAGQ